MPFVLKDCAEIAGLPTVALAGETLYVPRARLGNVLAMIEASQGVDAILAKIKAAAAAADAGTVAPPIKQDEFAPLIETVRQGLLPLYPTLSCADLRDAEIDLSELVAAYYVVQRQAASRRRPPTGETGAAGPQPQPIGESSSPTSSSS